MKYNLRAYGLYILFLGLLSLYACGTFFTKTPTQSDISMSQLAVQNAASIEAISRPELVPEMLKVSAYVVSVINSGNIITLAGVQAELNAEATSLHMSPQSIQLANLFLNDMIFIIQQKGQVSLTVPVQACMVAQWVNNAIGGNSVCTNQLVAAPTVTH